jgi:SNF2 family DNA or RNA helicase
MGLGKSAQAITAADILDLKKILVLCPAVGRFNWVREFQKFSLRDPSFFPVPILQATERPLTHCGIICSYNLMTNKELSTWILSQTWDLIILDEVHYLKNRNAQRTEAIFGALTHAAGYVWALSGTLAPNGCAGELYPVLYDFGSVTGDYWNFVRRFCYLRDTPFGTIVRGIRRPEQLKALLNPIFLRRKKEDVIRDLPPILFTDHTIEAGPVDLNRWYPELETHMKTPERLAKMIEEQQAAIDAVVNLTGLGADGIGALGRIQARCMQSLRFTGLQKIRDVVEIVSEELRSGAYDKIVLFAVHRAVVEDLWERLRKFNPVTLYGGTPAKKRDRRIREFQTDPECKIFIGNIQSAGTSITLTAAHQVGFVEASWVPEENAQAAMRVHRIGQTKPVTVRFFNIANSSDEKIQMAIRRKTSDIVKLYDNGPGIDIFA